MFNSWVQGSFTGIAFCHGVLGRRIGSGRQPQMALSVLQAACPMWSRSMQAPVITNASFDRNTEIRGVLAGV